MSGGAPAGLAPLSGSVRGANKQYNQDAYRAATLPGGGAAVLAVADGHGSKKHFRSHLGSRWAVEEFTACVTPFALAAAARDGSPESWSDLYPQARALAGPICHRWRERALLHEAGSPARGDRAGLRSPTRADLVPYGTTLIGLVVTRRLVFGWQVGDGDLTVSWDGAEPERPLAGPGEEEIGDDTDSLCQPEPWTLMRVLARPLPPPATRPLVVANTDGLSKSYPDTAGYLQFVGGLRDSLVEHGADSVQLKLGRWLGRAAGFSGDDSTLVGVYAAG